METEPAYKTTEGASMKSLIHRFAASSALLGCVAVVAVSAGPAQAKASHHARKTPHHLYHPRLRGQTSA